MQYPSVLCLKSLPLIGQANSLAADGQDRDRKIYLEGLISLSGHEAKTLFESVIETLHFNTSLVSDPIVVQTPFVVRLNCQWFVGVEIICVRRQKFECDICVLKFMGYGLGLNGPAFCVEGR